MMIYMNNNTQSDNKTKRICVVDTPFSLFYYLLLFGVNEDDIFVMSKNIPKPIRDNINHIYFPINQIYPYDTIKHILMDLWFFILLFYDINKLRIKLKLKTKGFNVKSYGHGHLLFSFPLYEYQDSSIIEDGVGNYAPLPEFKEFSPIPKFIFNKLFGKYIRKPIDGFGTHPKIKHIYLTKNQGYVKHIESKVITKGLDELTNSIDKNQKDKILKIYNADTIINSIDENDILLLTEPFTECLELTIEEEIEIYKDIISKYNPNQIIIKPHPGERKDYSKYFPDIRIITTPFPLELFDLMDVKFKKIITIESSAALNFKNIEVEFYNGKISNEKINKRRERVKKQYQKLYNKKN